MVLEAFYFSNTFSLSLKWNLPGLGGFLMLWTQLAATCGLPWCDMNAAWAADGILSRPSTFSWLEFVLILCPISVKVSSNLLAKKCLKIQNLKKRKTGGGAPRCLSQLSASWFQLGSWFQGCWMEHHFRLCAECGSCLRFSLPFSRCPSPMCVFSCCLSIILSVILSKMKKKYRIYMESAWEHRIL